MSKQRPTYVNAQYFINTKVDPELQADMMAKAFRKGYLEALQHHNDYGHSHGFASINPYPGENPFFYCYLAGVQVFHVIGQVKKTQI